MTGHDVSAAGLRRWSPLIFAVTLLALVGWMVFAALGFAEQARRIPLVVGGPTLVLIAMQVIRVAMARPDPSLEDDTELARVAADAADAPEALESAEMARQAPPRAEGTTGMKAIGWVLFLAGSVLLLGLLPTVPLFAAAFMRRYGREPWWVIGAVTAGTLAVVYGFFIRVLEVRIFGGFLWEWLA
ncbi:tripartite tricarboxylate transporter TctB family protein [Egicoccus sp. AB-alg6-2]|uniref:tripartite tricarboxylate transporter TctB family protein n=1 Tax=Egicoccus sp. AB-alg6-2 TaxID=3242692 RepID=UPI00359D13C4